MNKVFIIAQVEFLNRIKKRAFLLMTFLGPLIIALILIVPIGLALKTTENHAIEVLDQSKGQIFADLPIAKDRNYIFMKGTYENVMANFLLSNNDALLIIPPFENSQKLNITLLQNRPLSKSTIATIKADLKELFVNNYIASKDTMLEGLIKGFNIQTQLVSNSNNFSETAFIVALTGAMAIYMFIFIYGVQVMRSVLEDKTSRVVELIITSVRPIQLMSGKIIGIGLASIFQLLCWIALSMSIILPIYSHFKINRFSNDHIEETIKNIGDVEQAMEMNFIINSLASLELPLILFCFICFFIFGYVLYAGLFCCVAAMIDNETDSQQFVVPITAPMVGTILLMQVITQAPHSGLSMALSLFPLTSPIAMMLRLPFGVSGVEIILSITILILSTLGVLWMSGKIYRTGILMYGKKASLREVLKWLSK